MRNFDDFDSRKRKIDRDIDNTRRLAAGAFIFGAVLKLTLLGVLVFAGWKIGQHFGVW